MWGRKKCGCRKIFGVPLGPILIALGGGILLGYIIPYYILITIFGIALIAAGIMVIRRR